MNVKALREEAGLSQQELSDKTAIPKDRIAKWEQGKGSPKATDSEILKKFFNEYIPHETMVREEEIPLNKKTSDFISQRRAQKNASTPHLAAMVPIKARAGYVNSYDQVDFMDALEKYALPPGVNPQGAIWRYFEVDGESMEPTFSPNDVVLASQVPGDDWQDIRNFYIYVIVTETQILIKRLYRKSKGSWVMISDNEKEHPQKLILVSEIKELWVFRRHINAKAPPPKKFEIKV